MYFYSSEGKSLKDGDTVGNLGLKNGDSLYFKDLGPQVGWTTVGWWHRVTVTDC